MLNNRISEHIFTALATIGVPTHFIRRLNMREQLIRQVEIIPIEVVVRNVAAGSLSKRLGIEEGTQLPRTIIEYYYKDDALGDPMIADEHIACFGWASQDEMNDIADMAIRVNDFMCGLFAAIGIRLIDFKLEFGRIWDGDFGRIILADEISPRRLPPVGHEDQREARQGPLPPEPRRRSRSLSGSRPPPRPAARRTARKARSSTSTATARSGASRLPLSGLTGIRLFFPDKENASRKSVTPERWRSWPARLSRSRRHGGRAGSVVVAPLGPRQLIGVAWEAERLQTEEVGDNRLRPLAGLVDVPPIPAPLRRLVRMDGRLLPRARSPRCCEWCCRLGGAGRAAPDDRVSADRRVARLA